MEILPEGISSTGVKSREIYPLSWPAPDTTGATTRRSETAGEKDRLEHAHDDLQSRIVLTMKPAQPLEPHTDYLLLLRNGLPVVPVGPAEAPLCAYRSAGVLCEDKIIQFRSESKGNRRIALKLTAEEEQRELEKSSDPKRCVLETKDLSKVDWKAIQTRISAPLASNLGSRDYLKAAQTAWKTHSSGLEEQYKDGQLSQKIEKTFDDINPQYFKAKCERVVIP